jgi:O-antigen chain-terminating methyltransferase
MLQACRDRGLKVEVADAVAYLKALPSHSLCLVSGFHIAEHLPFHVLQQLIIEAKRVLTPGGLLILETPNPENIMVGTSSFYLDPTHERPIPPELLSFLPEYYGYQRTKVLRLQESPELYSKPDPRLLHVLNGVSPDYAVVAQTEGFPLLTEALTPAFEKDYGLTLHTLAERYQQTLEQRLSLIEDKAQQAQGKAKHAEERATHAEAVAKHAEERATHAEAVAHQYASQLLDVRNSTSWRITAPLRWPVLQWRLLRQYGAKARIIALARRSLCKLWAVLDTQPTLKSWAIRFAYRLGLAERIKSVIRNSSLRRDELTDRASSSGFQVSSDHTVGLTPRSRQIYCDLKAAIDQQQKRDL